jgi:hypothetical protein
MARLPAGLLSKPAFTAGLFVQLAFAAGLQGFSLVLALWLQSGQHYSPIRAGVTTVALSSGAFLTAGLSIQLAAKLGRTILIFGGLLMAERAAARRATYSMSASTVIVDTVPQRGTFVL